MKTSNQIVIADSSALYSLLWSDDSNHQMALELIEKIRQDHKKVILPIPVFVETLNIVSKKLGRDTALTVAGELSSGNFMLIEATEVLSPALEKFRSEPATTSFTDCLVMAFADAWETKEIFGFDDCFFKSGYQPPQ